MRCSLTCAVLTLRDPVGSTRMGWDMQKILLMIDLTVDIVFIIIFHDHGIVGQIILTELSALLLDLGIIVWSLVWLLKFGNSKVWKVVFAN